jgi:hypothetical protein
MYEEYYLENLKVGKHFGDMGVCGGAFKMCLKETGYEAVDWTNLAQGRVQWRTLLNTVENSLFHKRYIISRLTPSFSKIQVNIVFFQCRKYQVLSLP